MKQITFYTVAERKPKHNEEVLLVTTSGFYNSSEFEYATIEYQWEQFDENEGYPTGTDFVFEEDQPQPPNTRLKIVACGNSVAHSLFEDQLWANAEDVDNELFGDQWDEI